MDALLYQVCDFAFSPLSLLPDMIISYVLSQKKAIFS